MTGTPNSLPSSTQQLKYKIKSHLDDLPVKQAEEVEKLILNILNISDRQWRRYKFATVEDNLTIPEGNLRKICKILKVHVDDIFNYEVSLATSSRQLVLEALSAQKSKPSSL